MARTLFAAAVALALVALAAAECPIQPSQTPLDFTPVASACAAGLGGDFCGSCICSLVDAYMPAFKAANLSTSDPGLVNSAASIITDCTTAYYSSLQAAQVDVTQLAAVGSCNFTSAQDLPPCLIERVAKIGADAPVAASDGPADAAAGAPALRVATVVPGANGPNFTLAGQLSSVADLVKAMQASRDLAAALTPEQAAELKALNASALDSSTELVDYVAAITNPVEAGPLLAKLADAAKDAAADAPAAAPAAGAPTAAPASGVAPTAPAAPAAPAAKATSSAVSVGASALAAAAALVAAVVL